ncbi:MAG: shikimate dehydrogenase [Calditrichaceae bacterium]|nr:shikimate dehydrogenase [Calditrichaceae bacterium]MBN2709915.1 shikimate dehydrogenase [Calditrichaceae bacterium]RQV92668.1 MAG: shikimate dehydrogenase [Calditrichota bacterium]
MSPDKYCIIGYPLGHTLSPYIHNAAFKDLGINAHYESLEIDPKDFETKINELKSSELKGFNITVPYKEKIFPYLNEVEEIARQIGAVNTVLKVKDNYWKGYNTDYIGFLAPVRKKLYQIRSALIIGAGGAARAVCFGLISEARLKKLTIVNRTLEKADKLKEEINRYGFDPVLSFDINNSAAYGERYDLIIQTTLVGMGKDNRHILLNPVSYSHQGTIVYDLIYNPAETAFLKKARNHGLKTINGWSMLTEQARQAFIIWTGQDFPVSMQKNLEEIYHRLLNQ